VLSFGLPGGGVFETSLVQPETRYAQSGDVSIAYQGGRGRGRSTSFVGGRRPALGVYSDVPRARTREAAGGRVKRHEFRRVAGVHRARPRHTLPFGAHARACAR
jgi:hypothetical protein